MLSDGRLKNEICKSSNSQFSVVIFQFSSTKLVTKHVCETTKTRKTRKTIFFECFCSEKTTFPVFVDKNWKIGGMRLQSATLLFCEGYGSGMQP